MCQWGFHSKYKCAMCVKAQRFFFPGRGIHQGCACALCHVVLPCKGTWLLNTLWFPLTACGTEMRLGKCLTHYFSEYQCRPGRQFSGKNSELPKTNAMMVFNPKALHLAFFWLLRAAPRAPNDCGSEYVLRDLFLRFYLIILGRLNNSGCLPFCLYP